MIVLTALLLADGRLYEAAESLRHAARGASSSRSRCPARKYGLVSAAMVVFSYTRQRLRHPEGDRRQLQRARDRHLQAGDRPAELQQGRGGRPDPAAAGACSRSSSTGAMQRRQQAQFSARAVPYVPQPRAAVRPRDARVLRASSALLLLAVLGMAVYTSFIKLWPYDLSFSLRHYTYGLDRRRRRSTSYFNSLKMALLTRGVRHGVHLRRRLPAREDARHATLTRPSCGCSRRCRWRCPGMVLGLGYILFFNHPDNPLNFLYGTMTILVLSTIVHYYTSSHLTAVTALKAARQRVRGGVGVAQGAVLQDVLPRDGAGVPAGDPRHRPLLLRQRDGDDLRRRVPVFARRRSSRRSRS